MKSASLSALFTVMLLASLVLNSSGRAEAERNQELENYSIKFLPHSQSNSEPILSEMQRFSLETKRLSEQSGIFVCRDSIPVKTHQIFHAYKTGTKQCRRNTRN